MINPICYDLKNAVTNNNKEKLKNILKEQICKLLHYENMDETYYQALMLGHFMILMDDYKILSNREVAHGRPDIILEPKSRFSAGIIIEIKSTNKRNVDLKSLAKSAITQINKREYEIGLAGINTIYKYGIAFRRKEVEVVSE